MTAVFPERLLLSYEAVLSTLVDVYGMVVARSVCVKVWKKMRMRRKVMIRRPERCYISVTADDLLGGT